MPTVFIISEDWTLRSLVRAELREHGVEALGLESVQEAVQALAAGAKPSAIILDLTSLRSGPGVQELIGRSVPVLVVTSPGMPVPAGATVVLAKPVQVGEIVAKVESLLKGMAA